ncbi:tryptophan 7-halogenase [Neptunicella marina]|uniref:Tryptophan 7-halogenase n=1 Tax=Neptunicella marina TaxID=2125989 RepID=A0A8J6ITP2_9ALTE|nr:tryptophan 7-halogenase [Neptunicella marina]MBC3765431.1 tryptophan 7-halogenase [Neptunicella marina]
MTTKQDLHIALIGSGFDFYAQCALLAAELQPFSVRISAFESVREQPDKVEIVGPEIAPFCQQIELALKTLMQQTKAGVSLGMQYQLTEKSFFVPYADYGLGPNEEFVQGVVKLAKQHQDLSINQFNLAARAASNARFAVPPANRTELKNSLKFGLNLPTKSATTLLKQQAEKLGVNFFQGEAALSYCTSNDSQKQLDGVLLDGQLHSADLYLLCNQVNGKKESKSTWCVASACTTIETSAMRPYRQCIATELGWLYQSLYGDQLCYQFYFDKSSVSEIDAAQLIKQHSGSDNIRFDSCSQTQFPHWQNNVISFNVRQQNEQQQCVSNLVWLMQISDFLSSHFPASPNTLSLAACFNQHMQNIAREIEQYYALHKLAEVNSSKIRSHAVAGLYARCGRLPQSDYDVVSSSRWHALLAGLGIQPELDSLYLQHVSLEQLIQKLQHLDKIMQGIVAGMPDYAAFYQQLTHSQ